MKLPILLLLLGLATHPAPAQRTKNEMTKATTPAEDSKPNSDAVPDVYASYASLIAH